MRGPPVDRISNLPSSILDNILKYLPLRDAVRTSILSRAWRNQWRTMPHLIFDYNFQRPYGSYNIQTIIYHILALHKGSITKFLVEVHEDSQPVDWWLFFLSDQHLEDLTLSNAYRPNLIPLRLFDFKQLRHLHLELFEIPDLPPTFQGFTRLVKLEIWNAVTKGGKLENFLSKCPMLRYLKLKIDRPGRFMGDLPQSFCQSFDHSFDHLTVLNLEYIDFSYLNDVNWVLSFMKNSPNLQCLKISCINHWDDDHSKPEVLSYLSAQRKANAPLNHLRIAEISEFMCSDVQLEFIKTLLLQAKALKKLILRSNSPDLFGGINLLKSLASFKRVVCAKEVTVKREGRSLVGVILW